MVIYGRKMFRKQHELYPISINYVRPMNVTDAYHLLSARTHCLRRRYRKQFILGSTYQYNYNQLANGLRPENAYYLNALLCRFQATSRGLYPAPTQKLVKKSLYRESLLRSMPKVEFDGRYYRRLGLYSTWANRIIAGVGIPYGNSVQLPFIKQFFVGGNNSLRGFRSRSVGPGTYKYPVTSNILNEETGDINWS